MSDTNPTSGTPTNRMSGRRLRYRAAHLALALAATALAILATRAADRVAPRIDATLTAESKLSPRTTAVLDTLTAPHELVLAADLTTADRWAREQIVDIVERFGAGSAELTTSIIDTASPAGPAALDALLTRLASREALPIAQRLEALESAAAQLESLPAALTSWSDTLIATRDQLDPQAYDASRRAFDAWAAAVRLHAEQTATAATTTTSLLTRRIGASDLPPMDLAATAASTAMRALARDLAVLARELDAFLAEPRVPAAARDALMPIAAPIASTRDTLARRADELSQTGPRAVRLARAVEAGQAAFVLGPPEGDRVAAVPAEDLLSASALAALLDAQRADLRHRVEDRLATALAAVASPNQPIVILTHAEARPFVFDAPVFDTVRARLALRGIDLLEWAVVAEPTPPSTVELDPAAQRPVVYAILSPDASIRGSQGVSPGAQRAATLAQTLTDLARAGQPMLVGLNPSVLPSFGSVDPLADALAPLGITANTGTPILATDPAEQIATDLPALVADADHPLTTAIAGLPTLLPWAVPLEIAEDRPARTIITPLLTIATEREGQTLWAESQWIRLWATPREQRPLIQDPPARDDRDGTPGPWTVALALERTGTDLEGPHRVVVIGSNTWYVDAVAEQRDLVDGRSISRFPGNTELFDNAIEWLAQRDQLIGAGAGARTIALIGPIPPDQLAKLRWALVLGLPGSILLLGALWRLVAR